MKECCKLKENKKKNLSIKKYFPLFIIVLLSLMMSLSLSKSFSMGLFMGCSFIFLAFLKLIDLKGFVQGFKNYDPLTMVFNPIGYSYPFFELGLGLYLLANLRINEINVISASVLLLTGAGIVYQKFIKKRSFSCACMGSKVDVPLGAVSLFENLVMAGMLIYLSAV